MFFKVDTTPSLLCVFFFFLVLWESKLAMASLVAQTVKHLTTMWETQVQSLGQENPPGKKKWEPTLVFLPGKSHGLKTLVGYSPWSHKELDTLSLSTGNKSSISC